MKHFNWNKEKNKFLIKKRKICFDDILEAIESGNLLDTVKYPDAKKYPKQRIFAVKISNYVYLVPFVINENKIFLKTIYPSRKATKRYLGKD